MNHRPLTYYKDLITSQHRDKPKFMDHLAAALELCDDGSRLASLLDEYFDLERVSDNPYLDYIPAYIFGYSSGLFIASANGKQLDVLGEWIGVSRTVTFNPTDGSSPVLTDSDYRIVLLAKIAKNNWDGQIKSLIEIWESLFPGYLIIINDNQDMTMTVLLAGSFSPMMIDLITHGYIVPKPEGVLVNYVYGHLPVFGYDSNDNYIAPYDTGWWANIE